MNEEMDILGFDPSQLSVFAVNENTQSNQNHNLYVTRPSESKSADGVYRAKIKIIYSPQNWKNSIVEYISYAMQDENGFFQAPTSLMVGDKSCPIFTAWKKCHFAEAGSVLWKQAATLKEGGKALFDRRYARYVTIQVLEDKNHPELEGKYMFFKLPKSIYDMIQKKQNPSEDSGKCPVPVMDFLYGYPIELEVNPGPDDKAHPERKTREITYTGEFTEDPEPCTYPDKTSLLNDEEQEVLDKYVRMMKKVWKSKPEDRAELLAEANNSEAAKELRGIYRRVLEELKGFVPDVNEEFKFKPWDEALTKRVQHWIDIVLSGNEPKSAAAAPAAVTGTATDSPAPAAETSTVEVEAPKADADDDLPF